MNAPAPLMFLLWVNVWPASADGYCRSRCWLPGWCEKITIGQSRYKLRDLWPSWTVWNELQRRATDLLDTDQDDERKLTISIQFYLDSNANGLKPSNSWLRPRSLKTLIEVARSVLCRNDHLSEDRPHIHEPPIHDWSQCRINQLYAVRNTRALAAHRSKSRLSQIVHHWKIQTDFCPQVLLLGQHTWCRGRCRRGS